MRNGYESTDLQISTDEFHDDPSSTEVRIKSNNKTASLFHKEWDGVKEQDVYKKWHPRTTRHYQQKNVYTRGVFLPILLITI